MSPTNRAAIRAWTQANAAARTAYNLHAQPKQQARLYTTCPCGTTTRSRSGICRPCAKETP